MLNEFKTMFTLFLLKLIVSLGKQCKSLVVVYVTQQKSGERVRWRCLLQIRILPLISRKLLTDFQLNLLKIFGIKKVLKDIEVFIFL